MKIITAVLLLILLPLTIICLYSILTPKEPAKIEEEWWGGENRNVDKSIKPFRITWSNEEIEDLKYRLNNTREPIPPLEGAAWTYGTSATYLKDEVLSYWLNKYNFKARLEFLNHYPQFITNIQGLDIHFIHVKPSNTEGKRVLPLLILHGWPGSIAEFHKAIALLTKPRKNHDFVFEVVAPSLPGFGYSEAARRPGLHSAHIALILKNLMVRLGHEKYYVHGGDWGAIISAQMSALRPENVMGLHSTMCTSSSPIVELKRLLYSLYPSLIVSDEDYHLLYPLSKQLMTFIRSTGYLHIQATKPDSLGVSLSDSPAGLASYILEKFSDATKRGNSLKEDGGLYENFTPDELIDNLMMYWIPNKITTSMRIYAESFNKQFNAFREQWPVTVPTACAQFPHEIIWLPEEFLKDRFRNLIQVTRMPRGGHFSMFEEPELATDDIWNFIEKAEALKLSHSHSTNKQDL